MRECPLPFRANPSAPRRREGSLEGDGRDVGRQRQIDLARGAIVAGRHAELMAEKAPESPQEAQEDVSCAVGPKMPAEPLRALLGPLGAWGEQIARNAIGAAMAAIIQFSRATAFEAKRQMIRVNCLTPSIVEGTPLHDRLMADKFAGQLFGKAKTRAHLGVVTPGDLAAMATFLASDEAARVTGQTISVTGGISAI